MDSMDLDWDSDQMEYEYTNPSYNGNNSNLFNRNPPIIDNSVFKIPESYLDHSYKKSNFLTTAVCSLLDKFSLNDDSKDTVGVSTATATEPSDKALVLRKAPTEAELQSSSLFDSLSLSSSSPIPTASTETKSLDRPEAPSTPLPLLNSPSPQDNSAVGTATYDKTSANIPSYTFIYNAGPGPEPLDPLKEQHGAIYYLFGIFRLVCASILFSGVLYIFAQFFKYVQHDMKAIIASYESDLLGDQLYCQHQYELNQCSPQTRLPAIADLCRDWERCMLRPLAVSKTKVLAEIVAEMWNGFTKTLTVKSMILNILIGTAAVIVLSNIIPSILSKGHSNTPISPSSSSSVPSTALSSIPISNALSGTSL